MRWGPIVRRMAFMTMLSGAILAIGCSTATATPTVRRPTSPPANSTATPQTGTVPTSSPPSSGNDLSSIPFTTTRSVALNGAGATFPGPLYTKFSSEYNKLNSGVRVNYQAIGSGGGIQQLTQKTVDFGASDAPMTAQQETAAGSPVIHIPTAMGAIVITYNLPNSPKLRLSGPTVSNIFLGKITKWNDPAIAADNPGVTLQGTDIAVVHRSDGSGTTFGFTTYLAAVSDEWKSKVGASTAVEWPAGVGGKGNDGVASQVKQIPGAVGYVELAYAHQNGLPVAMLKNKAGSWVEPTLETTSAAAAGMVQSGAFPEDLKAITINADGANSYPIATFTWYLLYQDLGQMPGMTQEKAEELVRYVLWSVDPQGGQQYHAALDYAPLDPLVVGKARAKLKTITFNGKPVWESMRK